MNLPNALTILRLGLTVLLVTSLSVEFRWHCVLALGLFVAASITDYLDGEIARRCHLITDFGKLMDPLADKILTAATFICLINYHLVPSWVVIIIISREFLITGLRLLASSKGIILPAEKLGKHKTAWQMITILYFLVLLTAVEIWGWPLETFAVSYFIAGRVLIIVTVVLTIYSGLAYFWKNRSLLSDW